VNKTSHFCILCAGVTADVTMESLDEVFEQILDSERSRTENDNKLKQGKITRSIILIF